MNRYSGFYDTQEEKDHPSTSRNEEQQGAPQWK